MFWPGQVGRALGRRRGQSLTMPGPGSAMSAVRVTVPPGLGPGPGFGPLTVTRQAPSRTRAAAPADRGIIISDDAAAAPGLPGRAGCRAVARRRRGPAC
jgi:hypothetical protein